jgi:hypothetical protein
VAAGVHRPSTGPRHDPQWILLGMSPTQTPGTRAGWADSIGAAAAAALTAWHMARMAGAVYGQLGAVRRPKAARPRWLEPSPKSPRSRCKGRVPAKNGLRCLHHFQQKEPRRQFT